MTVGKAFFLDVVAGDSHDCLSAGGSAACLLSINHTMGQRKQGSFCEGAK